MVNKILLATALADALFLASGVAELALSLVVQSRLDDTASGGKAAVRNLLFRRFPLTAGIVNGAFVIATFVATVPALLMSAARGWLKLTGYLVAICAVFTMCVGVYLWIMTLTMADDFLEIYLDLEPETQSLIQASFECCGYFNSTVPAFVTDATCPSPAAASLLRGCQRFISSFSNAEIDGIFTAVFGVVGIDALFILAIACLSKDRKEREWYRRLDQKKSYW